MNKIKIAALVVFIISIISSCFATEEFIVAHAPPSVKFTTTDPLRSSFLGDVFSAVFGFTISTPVHWRPLSPVSPFDRPEAIMVIDVLGFKNDMELDLGGIHFLLENEGDVDSQYDTLSYRTYSRYSDKKPVLIRMDANDDLYSPKAEYRALLKSLPASKEERFQLALTDPKLGQKVEDGTFNSSDGAEVQLLTELATVKDLMSSVSKQKSLVVDGVPDVYWLKLSGIKTLVDKYGEDSYKVTEGIGLLKQTIAEVIAVSRSMYGNMVMVALVTEDAQPPQLQRKTRSLLFDNAPGITPVCFGDTSSFTRQTRKIYRVFQNYIKIYMEEFTICRLQMLRIAGRCRQVQFSPQLGVRFSSCVRHNIFSCDHHEPDNSWYIRSHLEYGSGERFDYEWTTLEERLGLR